MFTSGTPLQIDEDKRSAASKTHMCMQPKIFNDHVCAHEGHQHAHVHVFFHTTTIKESPELYQALGCSTEIAFQSSREQGDFDTM